MDAISMDETVFCSVAEVHTAHATRYMVQLCKHFEHRAPATYDAVSGSIRFTMGECRLRAEEGVLRLEVFSAEAAGLAALQEVLARHLVRFAFREEMAVVWRAG